MTLKNIEYRVHKYGYSSQKIVIIVVIIAAFFTVATAAWKLLPIAIN